MKVISKGEALKIISEEETHFLDLKSKEISGKKIQKIVSSFANADGGEIYVGIWDEKEEVDMPIQRWNGFENQEEANQLIQSVTLNINPSPQVDIEFYKVEHEDNHGIVMKISVFKSAEIHYTADNKVYVRKGAQSLPISGQDIINLQLSKGLISYEDQLVSGYDVEELVGEKELSGFLGVYSPKMEKLEYLKKQRLVRKNKDYFSPNIAAVLLYADNPSAILAKKCSVKITRYDTSEIEPKREHLKEQYTVEGCLMTQIQDTLDCVKEMIEAVPILVNGELEKAKYPIEAIQEIVVNALIHRDYNLSDDTHVLIFNNRIEVKNPGRLPGHITVNNILEERFARNPTIVRLLNKYPNPPNKDIGEGLNTAFQKMQEMRLKSPKILIENNKVVVTLPHDSLASPEETVIEYLKDHDDVNNRTARKLCGISSENTMKNIFVRLRDQGVIEKVPGRKGSAVAWRLVEKV
ncbi:putative DNA binding domain-containing protein [Bacillus cereus]|uniref:RNA-binding domain-containing protein n=1 Tax=Bacillus cereus TaxID=1396 RepID=UPI001CE32FF1|nr:putative DNA binding domain-containing protein [Bacillus cereus]MCU5477215.1 putative DNA binding domain-containing protein [Bacillus cereus]MCU5615261.1 putative DNA binding domain-containing protein [Bacillus cereus]